MSYYHDDDPLIRRGQGRDDDIYADDLENVELAPICIGFAGAVILIFGVAYAVLEVLS